MTGLGDFDGWTIVFDLDGTLVDTAPDLLGALNHVLSGAGLPPVSMDVVASLIGHGARSMMERGFACHGTVLSEAEMDRAFGIFLTYYMENIAVGSRPFERATEALDTLLDQGAVLAVCTNKRQALSERLLDELGLSPRFRAVLGADRASAPKPDASHVLETISAARGEVSRSLFVGDSLTDARAARNAGLPFVFTSFGYDRLSDGLKPDAVIDHYDELAATLVRLRDQALAASRGR
jgi:phosphoglycolate phosphatase